MRVLLTGAAGFIGSHLAERLCARGDTVVGFDNFDRFYPRAIKERNLEALRGSHRFQLIEGDLCRRADVARTMIEKVDAVVHLAALAGVRPSIAEPARFWDVNVTGTLNLVEVCRARGVRRLVFASSSSVYGDGSEVPFRESDPCGRPLSPYAATKRSGELLAFNAHHLYGMDVTCLRFFTVYGPRQRPDLAIHRFAQLFASGQPIPMFGDGSSSRDYTWIDDIVDGVVAAIDQVKPGYRIYNLGGSRPTSLSELVDLLSSAMGKTPIIDRQPEQPGDMPRTLAEVSLAARELGYAPKVGITEGIPRFVKWFLTQPLPRPTP